MTTCGLRSDARVWRTNVRACAQTIGSVRRVNLRREPHTAGPMSSEGITPSRYRTGGAGAPFNSTATSLSRRRIRSPLERTSYRRAAAR